MINCERVAALTREGRDRPLGRWLTLKLTIHRFICGPCRFYKRQLDTLGRAAAALGEDAGAQVAMDDAARDRIRERLRAAQRTE
ncbi:MAG: zf-HC2 domain-containing protein [Gammaproteobacteria bacterium]